MEDEISWLRVLLDNISSYLSLSSSTSIDSNPAHEYYTRGENIAKLLKPVLESLIGSDSTMAAPSDLLNNGFEELAQYVDELKSQFDNWQPLSISRILYVLRIESVASKLRESSLEVFQMLKHCEQHLPAEVISPSFEECMELVKLLGREEMSYIIDQALIDQRESNGPTSEILMKIAETIGLTSNQEILIEGVVLTNMKENSEVTETEFIDGLINLTTRMHDYLIGSTKLRYPVPVPSDFLCPLSLEVMTDPVIVSSGQTYERVFIEKWIGMGLMVCPKTRMGLSHTTLTPNFIVKAFIANWCEAENITPPDPLELIRSTQSFPFLGQSGNDSDGSFMRDDEIKSEISSLPENSSPIGNRGNGHTESLHTESLDGKKFEEIRQVLSRSISAPGIVSKTAEISIDASAAAEEAAADASTSQTPRVKTAWGLLPSERHFRHPGIIPATIRETGSCSNSSIEAEVKKLIEDLKNPSLESQKEATSRIRVLSRNNTDNRIVIARLGAISSLVNLLYSTDEKVQADATTCLLNLSINDNNKSAIAETGAIEPLIHVLKTGNPEARSNAAATLFSLSVIEELKTKIGKAGAIEPLVDLLGNGNLNGKKDAATALFNLSIHHENKAKVIEAGAVRHLVDLMDPSAGMVEKAVVVLANLATIKEGKTAIGEEGGIPVLVEVVELGSARGKENATAALLQICMHSPKFCNSVIREGVIPPLVALTKSGTARGKEKAHNLLKRLKTHKQEHQRRS